MFSGENQKTQALYALLMQTDFDKEAFIRQLSAGKYSKHEINIAAYQYVYACCFDYDDLYEAYEHSGETSVPYGGAYIPGYASSHMLEAMEILLQFGLDPNYIVTEQSEDGLHEFNIMQALCCVYNGYLSADVLALFLNSGGNPNLIVDGFRIIENIDFQIEFDLIEQENRIKFDSEMHYWMVLVGFGALLEDDRPVVEPYRNFNIAKLKNHRNFYYGSIHSEKTHDHYELCVFDKQTNWEVARY